ncbi:MAG: isochorismatase family cysteine hydrolase [Anaerolineae bacterium]|jgi:nicotinamidase-related amidase
MKVEQLIENSRPFLSWLVDWYNDLPTMALAEAVEGVGGDAARVAVLAVDVTTGFCSEGALASERVGAIVPPIVQLFERAHELGVRHFILPQDTHTKDAVEFSSFPAHCVRGTDEPVTVPELSNLPFASDYLILEKNSISSNIDTGLGKWLDDHPEVTTFLVVGDCTDFCVHQLAMYLRLRANARDLREVRVIVPANTVDTFDIPVDVAREIGAMPHPGDLLHLIFLSSMAQNGVEIVAQID